MDNSQNPVITKEESLQNQSNHLKLISHNINIKVKVFNHLRVEKNMPVMV